MKKHANKPNYLIYHYNILMNTYNEIYIKYEDDHELFNSLSKEEKIFVYLMMRASLPFNRIYRDQNHRHNNEIIELFEFMYQNKKIIEWFDYIYNKKNNGDSTLFKDIETYLVYLWTNHGIYFLKDQSKHKRTPEKLKLTKLTEEILDNLLRNLKYPKPYQHLFPTIFNTELEEEMVVSGNIEQSGNNYYEKGFTEDMYEKMPENIKNKINAYFTKTQPYHTQLSVNDKYGEELKVTVYWLQQALTHIKQYPIIFDEHMVNSMEHMIDFLTTGNEESFKKYSIEWLKTKSKLDYNMGFIEQYHDPKQIRGHASAEITIQTTNMEKLNNVLLEIESRIPIPNEYKRTVDNSTILNVSVNQQLFGAGDYGTMQNTAAYNLPNYSDLREKYGSKQILYKMMDPVILDQNIWNQLVKDEKLFSDLWDLQVLLHELSHGSGKLYLHTSDTGESYPVTDDNLTSLIGNDYSALEELRAEINALYISIAEMDILNQHNMYKDWYKQMGEEKLKKYCIIEMTRHFFRRLIPQGEYFTEIKGSHCRANTIITNYILDGGGIKITDEVKVVDREEFHILGIEVVDFNKAFNSTVKLLQLVQEIKSTANKKKCDELFDKYTTYPITIDQAIQYRKYVMDIQTKLNGSIKSTARIYSNFQPIILNNQLVDVIVGNEQDIFEQNLHYNKLMMSNELI
ncbi:peptidase family M49 [Klosneuvirus KNV1]|uniref:Peptidase family M49 n=1 Tax=Klosneuvirus KNV1 TaxID=1977640 RepID=A0A1V0SKM1_9VIRU|nr:peptidase family M49 [Klosneuvirus KNV1]